jgi:hypothetical protein
MPLAGQPNVALACVPPEWRAKVTGTLINPDTLLATDYLNHFNEAVMLIGMVADMPEILADLQAWKPKSYPEHFRNIGIDYGPLAADAYDHVPPAFKEPFEITVGQLNQVILITAKRLMSALDANDAIELRRTGEAAVNALTTLVGTASGIIAGSKSTLAQNEIDRLLAIC